MWSRKYPFKKQIPRITESRSHKLTSNSQREMISQT